MQQPSFPGYRIVEELGAGPFSVVYKAVREPSGHVVVIKALKEAISPNSPFAGQLEVEARVLGGLHHRNIPLVFDFVKTAGSMYLVLEYVDGFSLAHVTAKRVRLPPESVAALGAEIAAALAYAHSRGVVHRDIKPSNILVSRCGDIKLIDFGIAQRLPCGNRAPTPPVNDAFGTPAYMSPEQILGEPVTPRSDLFSLGVVLYELLAGARPFGADVASRHASAVHRRCSPPVALRAHVPDLARSLERLVMQALKRLAVERIDSADAFAARLTDFVRSRTLEPSARLVQRTLEVSGLVPASAASAQATDGLVYRRRLLPWTMVGFAALSLLFGGSIALIRRMGRDAARATRARAHPLELRTGPMDGGMAGAHHESR